MNSGLIMELGYGKGDYIKIKAKAGGYH